MSLPLEGVYTALVTPFTADGSSVDFEAYERLIDHQLKGGVTGLVPCGTTGEAATLSDAEQREVISRTAQLARGKAVIVAGTGTNNTKKSIDASRAAVEAGADAVMIVMPYYTKPSQEGMFRHVREIARSVSCPVVLYNVPSRTIADLAVDTLCRILDACPNVVGLKDASGNVTYCQELLYKAPGRISVFSGDDPLTLSLLAVGATGVISVTSNVYPRQVGDVINEARAGRWSEAQRKNRALFPVHRVLFSEPSPQPIKAALASKGISTAALRLPMIEASPECKKQIQSVLATFEGA